MISFEEAVELVRSAGEPLGTEDVALAEAAGRVLAEPVVALIDAPRSNVSSMDGYAVCDEDLNVLPVELEVRGKSFAGSSPGRPVEPGTCVRIFTGAPVPAGADRIVMQEYVRSHGNRAIIEEAPGPSRYIRVRGSDFEAGEELLAAGRLLDARAIVASGAADLAHLKVYRRPRLSILSTGDELVEPGTARERGDAVPESVSAGVAVLASEWGCEVSARKRLSDDLDGLQRAAKAAAGESDIVLVTGGASVGERDFARRMFEPLGLELIFSTVAMKPGKPVWLGRSRNALVMGLPGNPTSAMVTARAARAPSSGNDGPADRSCSCLEIAPASIAARPLRLTRDLSPCAFAPRECRYPALPGFRRAADACTGRPSRPPGRGCASARGGRTGPGSGILSAIGIGRGAVTTSANRRLR